MQAKMVKGIEHSCPIHIEALIARPLYAISLVSVSPQKALNSRRKGASDIKASWRSASLLRLEEEDRAVAQVEVDEVLRLMCHEAAKIAPDDTVPCGSFP